MRHTRVQTPKGTKDFLPLDCRRKRSLESQITGTFEAWGYSEVVTPVCEFQDVALLAQGGVPDEAMFKLFDREGSTMVLRPDMTMPIGRVVATRLSGLLPPYRLYYSANVFRHTGVETGRQREFYQAGVELLGAVGPAADAEMLALAAAALRSTGLRDVCFDIGHVGFVQGLLQAGGFSERERQGVSLSLVRKDFVGLDECLSQHTGSEEIAAVLRDAVRMRGGRELLAEVRGRVAACPEAALAIDEIAAVLDYLDSYGFGDTVCVDLGMVKDFEYYTGVTAEGYVRELGAALCSGGRYDSLTEHFGFPCPATGFAIGIEWLMAALARQGERVGTPGLGTDLDVVIVLPDELTARALALGLVASLREAGLRVAAELVQRPPAATTAFAAQSGATWLLTMAGDGLRGELLSLADGHSHGVLSHEAIEGTLRGERIACQSKDQLGR